MKQKDKETFYRRWALWKESLYGEDFNSILNQIHRMTWDSAVFRVINEARRLAPPAPEGGVQLNGMLHQFINRCFFETQLIALRRLCDESPLESPSGKKDVYSLVSLLNDMVCHCNKIQRGWIFEAEKVEYDYRPLKQDDDEYIDDCLRKGNYCTGGNLEWVKIKDRHLRIDYLTGVEPGKGSPEDQVRSDILEYLKSRVEHSITVVVERVNKFIAHAATPESRSIVNADAVAITLKSIWDCQRTICEVAAFICNFFFSYGQDFLAVPSCDYLKYLEKPLVSEQDVSKLRETWGEYGIETHGWLLWGALELEREMKGDKPQPTSAASN